MKTEANGLPVAHSRAIQTAMNQRFKRGLLNWAGAGLIAWGGVDYVGLAASNVAPALTVSKTSTAPLVIPRPKLVHPGTGVYRFPAGARWTLSAAEREERLWRAAGAAFAGAAGEFVTATAPGFTLTVGSAKAPAIPAERGAARWAAEAEGYRLQVSRDGIVIQSSTAQGAFYGLQTLAQLWRAGDGGRVCPVVQIEDWPSMRFRGVHWFPSASGVPLHERLITNVFSALKFNRSVIQCEATRWDNYPEITAPNAISKADLRTLVEACRTRYLEPIPLLNTPGHAEWIFRNGSNLALAEDPKTPYAYCVNNPKSYEFIQTVLGECLPIFDSKFCHLGHDEVAMRGRFPNPDCPRCQEANATDLIVKHANHLAEWLAKQGIQSMIWGDMLLGPGEAKDATSAKTLEEARKRRAGIDKRTIIVDWHYAPGVDARSIELLRKDGFQVVAASWYTPENIRRLAQAALAANAEGMLQTTWMGYFPDARALRSQRQQFTAFVLAAEYCWSGRSDQLTELGYDAGEVFQSLLDGGQSH